MKSAKDLKFETDYVVVGKKYGHTFPMGSKVNRYKGVLDDDESVKFVSIGKVTRIYGYLTVDDVKECTDKSKPSSAAELLTQWHDANETIQKAREFITELKPKLIEALAAEGLECTVIDDKKQDKRFTVGDKVRIIAKDDMYKTWMGDIVGRVGEVATIPDIGTEHERYRVFFADKDEEWTFRKDSLQLVE